MCSDKLLLIFNGVQRVLLTCIVLLYLGRLFMTSCIFNHRLLFAVDFVDFLYMLDDRWRLYMLIHVVEFIDASSRCVDCC